jgi:putative transcriptional regulator
MLSAILDIMTSVRYSLGVMNSPVSKPSLANRLRVARAERRLSQDDLAHLAGVTRQTVSSIENGQYCPSALLAFLLARSLDKPVSELFYLEDEGGTK